MSLSPRGSKAKAWSICEKPTVEKAMRMAKRLGFVVGLRTVALARGVLARRYCYVEVEVEVA